MAADVIGPNIYVSTVADEGYFNYTEIPITLHHKNTEARKYDDGRQVPGYYHRQPYEFQTPLEVMAYIHRHSKIAVGRSLSSEAAQIRLVPGRPPILTCEGEPLTTGTRITALFPEGLRYVRLELVEKDVMEPERAISTPEYAEYSPVGLFVRLSTAPAYRCVMLYKKSRHLQLTEKSKW